MLRASVGLGVASHHLGAWPRKRGTDQVNADYHITILEHCSCAFLTQEGAHLKAVVNRRHEGLSVKF
jgi:hypothetical protein